jgi:hypothetical protein
MKLDLPFWFRQRQAKADELAKGSYKITGPNLPEGIVSIRIGDDLQWRGYLQAKADGPEVAVTTDYRTAQEAMAAAFELYRINMIV